MTCFKVGIDIFSTVLVVLLLMHKDSISSLVTFQSKE